MSQALYDEFMAIRNRNLVEGAPDSLLKEQYDLGIAENEDEDPIWPLVKAEWERRLAWKALQTSEPQVENPEIIVEKDFDGYFENQVRSWVVSCQEAGKRFRHSKLVITAGAYRSSAISMQSNGVDTLTMDFYAASRNGFGGLSSHDIAEIKNEWL